MSELASEPLNQGPTPLAAGTQLVVRTRSDWHIGSGSGVAGDLNATVRRDPDGLPYLPGTSLTGVLRDACRVVSRALDAGAADGPWQRWHTAVFGMAPDAAIDRPARRIRPALAGFGAARLRPGLAARLRAGGTEVATTRRPGVAIDPDTGRAADGALRMIEVARGGVDLVADVTIDPLPDDDSAMAASALLVLGAAWCAQVGGWRRRGLGEVVLEFTGQDARVWAGWLADSGWVPPAVPAPVDKPGTPAAGVAGGDWQVVDLRITTTGPVRVPNQVTGNVVRGLDHLPGNLLLAWLSQRWGAEVVRSAIWHRALIARTALPEVAGRRGWPTPLSLYRSRDSERTIFVNDAKRGTRQVRGHYTDGVLTGGELRLVPGRLDTVSHNAVNPRTQRPDSASGIYELEVIPPGTVLRGEVLVRSQLLAELTGALGERPWTTLAGPARFGARRRGEYGAAMVDVLGCAPAPTPAAPGPECRMWMVSDLVVRGPGLRHTAHPGDVADLLTRELGVQVELRDAVTRTRRRDGWHGGWQLPRDSVLGLAAGSVLSLVFPNGPPAPDRWSAMLHGGLGDRTAEGYGEVIVDAPLLTATTVRVADHDQPVQDGGAPQPDLDPADEHALAVLTAAAVADRVRFAIPDARNRVEYRDLHTAFEKISASQRGTWRAAAAAAAVACSLAPLRTQLGRAEAGGRNENAPQRKVAALLRRLTDGRSGTWWRVLSDAGVTVSTERERAVAATVLVADVLDDLRRAEALDDER